jgi:hypothetical protein
LPDLAPGCSGASATHTASPSRMSSTCAAKLGAAHATLANSFRHCPKPHGTAWSYLPGSSGQQRH